MSLRDIVLPRFTLGNAEVKGLIAAAQSGDEDARSTLIQANLRLVASLVQRYGDRPDSEDLFQVGTIGLIKAINGFDLSQEVRFSTYAVPVILGEIRQYLRGSTPLKVGRALQELAFKAMRKKEELSHSLDREPTVAEVAAALEVDCSDIVDALEAARPASSLFEPIAGQGDDAQFVFDRIKGDDGPEDTGLLDSMDLTRAMDVLNPRERLVIELRYSGGLTQAAIAPRLGVSQVQVFRIERAALEKLRGQMG